MHTAVLRRDRFRYVIITRPVRQGRLMLALEEVLAMQLDEELPTANGLLVPSDFTFQPSGPPAPGMLDPSGSCVGYGKAPSDTLISSFAQRGARFYSQASTVSSEGSDRKRSSNPALFQRMTSQEDGSTSNNAVSSGSLVVGHSTLRQAQVRRE